MNTSLVIIEVAMLLLDLNILKIYNNWSKIELMTEVQDKNMHFYNRARKEYENNRPLNYEFSLTKEDPKSRKFRILLGRIVEVFKEGM